jgi:hypothetical protein
LNDTHHETATEFFEPHGADNLLWSPCHSADLLHVAYAKELAADSFISFDNEQIDLANGTGLSALRPQ